MTDHVDNEINPDYINSGTIICQNSPAFISEPRVLLSSQPVPVRMSASHVIYDVTTSKEKKKDETGRENTQPDDVTTPRDLRHVSYLAAVTSRPAGPPDRSPYLNVSIFTTYRPQRIL